MNQKELYIQYLEDALNHAKTGEPMKKWQVKSNGEWIDKQYEVWNNLNNIKTGQLSIRIKPEPFKWTTFAFKPKDCPTVYHASHKDYVSKENICERLRISLDELLAVHYHEIEIE